MALEIKIGNYDRPIFRVLFSLFYGADNDRIEQSRLWFSFLGPSSLRIIDLFSTFCR